MKKLSRAGVIIFGVGGVGSWCAESLVRTGINNLTIVDSDIICSTNINRQVQATSLNIGKSKAEELGVRLRAINPVANITALHTVYDETTSHEFDLAAYDYVIDAIDSLKSKLLLLERCAAAGVTVYSSMGAGARNDPTKIKVDRIANTRNCPLARRVRKMLRDKNIDANIPCVYSEELPAGPTLEAVDSCDRKKQVNGSLVHVTAIFGFMLAGLVIENIASTLSA